MVLDARSFFFVQSAAARLIVVVPISIPMVFTHMPPAVSSLISQYEKNRVRALRASSRFSPILLLFYSLRFYFTFFLSLPFVYLVELFLDPWPAFPAEAPPTAGVLSAAPPLTETDALVSAPAAAWLCDAVCFLTRQVLIVYQRAPVMHTEE